MGNSIKRFLALALAVFMVIGMMPTNIAFAEETEACEHNYVDGVCEYCEAEEPKEEEPVPSEKEEEPAPSENKEEPAPSEEEEVVEVDAVAMVGDAAYETLAEAIAVGGEVKLLSDLVIDSETYTIADGKSVTLDMNGKKLTVTDNKTTNYELFYIYGEMTVIGNGTIELTATNDRDWNAMSAIFHNRGGVLTIENGTFTHKGGTDMAYVVDNSGNWYGDATTNVKDGTLTSSYIAIRNRMEQNSHGASGKAILNVSGGTISGTSRAIWAQAASTSETAPATGEINVSGGNIGLIDTPRSTGAVSMTTITGGNVAAFKGEVGELTVKGGTVGEVTMLSASGEVVNAAPNEDGVYVEKALVRVYAKNDAKTKTFSNFKAAIEFAVAQKGNVPVYLLDNVTVNETIVINDTNAGLVELQGDKTGGQTFTLTSTHSGELFRVEKGTLSVKNLKVNAQGDAFYVTGGIVNLNYHSKGKQFIEVTSQTGNCVYVRGGSVNVNGAKLTSLGEFPAIQGNGNYVGNVTLTKWNIGDGTYPVVSAPNTDIAIYWPGNGKLTIEGGEYTGDTAVYAKSGNIVISGGTFIGTGDAKAYEPYGNGAHATGDAVVIETSTDAAYETPVVSITGGHFASTYAQPIAVYGAGTAVNKFVSGGTFNKGLDNKIVAEGKATEKAEDGNWVIVNGVVYTEMNGEKLYYASLEEAIKAVPKNTSATITLLTNITTTGPMVGHQYVQDITIDLNGYTMSNNGIVLTAYRSGTTLTVKNGTLLGNASTGTLRATYGGRIVLGDNLTVKGMGGSAVLIYLDNGVLDITAKDGVKFEGGKQDLKKTDNANNKLNAVTVGRTGFGTLADAFAAAQDGDTILVHGDLAMDAMIVNTKKVTLDLNGCTITGTDNTSKNFSLIDNRSELTITGNGKMTLTATVNSGWNRYSAVIANNPGGKLVVENGTIEHLGGTDMAYGIDNLTNGKGTYAETVINGGTIKSTYRGIRQFLNGVEARNILTINGGTIEGANKSVWMQDPSKNPNTGSLTVGENANLVGDVYLFVTAGSTTWPVEVSIAVAALVEGSEVLTGNVPAGYKLEETNGIIGVVKFNPVAEVNGVAYETLQAAVEAAQPGETVKLLQNIEMNEVLTISGDVVIDFNGFTVTGIFADPTDLPQGNGVQPTVPPQFVLIEGGANVIMKDSTGNGGLYADTEEKCLNYLICVDKDSTLVIESGNYTQDYSVIGAGMIYTRGSDNLTVKGGNFHLGNVGTLSNGSPWIFNASGQNTRHIIVEGGTFNADILHQYYPFEVVVANNKALKNNGNGTYTMVDAVAYVTERHWSSAWYTNEVGYATLEEAIAACEGPKTKTSGKKEYVSEQEVVVLLKDIVLENGITISADQSVVLDLNGKTLSYKSEEAKASCAIENKGTLTIQNGTVTYEGMGDPAFGYGTNTINNSGNLTINANIINTTNSGSSNAIDNAPGAVLTVKGGEIKAEKIAIRLRDGSNVTIDDGTVTGARSVQIHLMHNNNKPTILTINDGTFDAEWSLYSTATGSCSHANTTVTINDGTFTGYVAFGGGTKTAQETVVINGGTFEQGAGRYLANDGWEEFNVPVSSKEDLEAAIAAGKTEVSLAKGTYDSFPASSLKEGVTLNAEGATFEGQASLNVNGATVVGATFSNESGSAVRGTINGTFKDCDFTGSNALRYCYAGDTVVFENCTFSGDVYGVHFDGGANEVVFKNCTFSGFNAMGGAITKLTMEGCTFVTNETSGYNGINLWGDTDMIDCTFVFDGTKTEWVDLCNDNKTVTFKDCTVSNGKSIAEVVGDYGTGNTIIIDGNANVATAESLQTALDKGANVTLTQDVEMESATTAPYGNKYAVKLDGGVLDGGNNELHMECYGDDYGVMTSGGTVKNLTIKEGCRAIMIMYPQSDIILDNVNIGGDGVLYPINTGEGGAEGVDLIVTNSTLAGWTSYGLIESASFTNVKFEQGTYYNNIYGRVLKPYVNTTLTDCSFVEHMNLDLSYLGQGQKITIVNCTVNGQAVNADVFTIPTTDAEYDTALFTVDLPSWASSINDCIVFG